MGSEARRSIQEWTAARPNTFKLKSIEDDQFIVTISLCTIEELEFKIICDEAWNPMIVASENEKLTDGVDMINMDLQVNASQSLYQVLTRALDAFSALIKTQPSPATSEGNPTPSLNTNASPALPSFPSPSLAPIAPPSNPSLDPAPAPLFSSSPPSSSSSSSSSSLPSVVPPTSIPPSSSADITSSDPSVRIRAEVEQWKRENGFTGLLVNSVSADHFKADMSLNVQGIPCTFQILFDENWFPMIVVANDPQLEDIITQTNVLLEEQQTQLLTHNETEGEEPPQRYSLVELLNVFGVAFASELRPTNMDDDDDDNKVTPTEEDWENTIIPSCITYMNGSGIAGFEREEWIRRLRTALKQHNSTKALTIVTQEIFGGAPLPSAISRFIPRRLSRPLALSSGNNVNYNTSGGNPEAVERLNNELLLLRATSSATSKQFLVTPINNDLFLWAVRLIYNPTEDFGRDLVAFYKKANGAPFSKIIRIGNHSNSPEVHLEIKFPPDYPNQPPLLRIIRPRFSSTASIETFFSRTEMTSTDDSTTTSTSTDSPNMPKRGLSISHNFENALTNWDPSFSVVDILKQLHHMIQRQVVDVEHADDEYAIPTQGTFWRLYTCEAAGDRLDIEHGGKIVLPPSAIEDLASQEFGDVNNFDKPEDTAATPMIFELSPVLVNTTVQTNNNNSVGRTFCGVAEFTAIEGSLVMPKWMMDNLGVQNGDMVQVRRVSLPRGTFLRLLPHNASFLEHTNPKALLEWVFPHYVALTPGDIIKISFDDKEHTLQVLEVSPGRAVCLTDSDITVDFAPPLDAPDTPSKPIPIATTTTTTTTSTTSTTSSTPPSGGLALGTLAGNGIEGVDYQTCTNCFAPVPKDRFTTHSLSCPRINWYCDKCKKVVQRSQKDEHIATVHAPTPCPLGCTAVLESYLVDEHVSKECPKRSKECEYCGLSITSANWHAHESACGDRTEVCEACGLRVQKREQIRHLGVCGQKTTPTKPPIQPARRQEEDLFQCEKCMTWCNGFDELQVHMLTQHITEAETDVQPPTTMDSSTASE